jgi:single-strand DNA-binding protein
MDLKFPRLNRIVVSGRLTRDGEVRYLPNGNAVFHCSIAIDDGYWDKQSNQWVSLPVYMDVTVWGAQGEKIGNVIKKGSPIIVEGRLRQRSYTTQEGQNRRITEINADKIHSLEQNRMDNNYSSGNNGGYNNAPNNYQQNNQVNNNNNSSNNRPEPDFINDDVPF